MRGGKGWGTGNIEKSRGILSLLVSLTGFKKKKKNCY